MGKQRSVNFVRITIPLPINLANRISTIHFHISFRFSKLGTIPTKYCDRREIGMYVVRQSQLESVERSDDGSIAACGILTATHSGEVSFDVDFNGNDGCSVQQRFVAGD